MVADRYGDVTTMLKFSDGTTICERPKKTRLSPEEMAERKLVRENIKNARKPLSPEKSQKVSEIFSIFKKKLKLTTAEIARGMSIDAKKLRRLCNREQPWKVGDVVKLEQAFPYWKDLAEKPDAPAQGSFCPDCGSNKSTVERTGTNFLRGLGHEDVILQRTRRCTTPNCKQQWGTYEISKERFEELAAKSLKKEVEQKECEKCKQNLKVYSKWTPERVEELEKLLETDLSAKEIGLKLGITRNSVIGKARRIGEAKTRWLSLVKEYQRSDPPALPDQPNSLDEFDLKIEKLKIVFDKGLMTPVELKTEILKFVKG